MYGPSGKLGRGGGPRRSLHAPPTNRPASTARLSMGGGAPRGRADAVSNTSAASSVQVEESFTMVRENPLNFGMAIKLAPNLVEEIKRVEAEGGTARIKFDANANNRDGNVIQVGDKTFRFTWSREPGDNCDVYEERQSGEDGNGLLIESGATWRKLNVERELDESTKNHVKRRSEEAERKLKSRKAIVLDHQTPSMKNQLKNLAAPQSNPRRNFKHRKEPPFKKTKTEQPSGGPPKSVYKSGLPATSLSKPKLSSGSPLSFQPEQRGGSAFPSVGGNSVKGHTGPPDAAVQNKNKVTCSDKGMQSRLPNNTVGQKLINNKNTETKPTDLRSLIISLLLKHQLKGMNLKALEKATGGSMPNSARQLEPILKQVATFQAPGKYFLKPGVEMESKKKLPPRSGSSPEISRLESPAPQKFDQLTDQDPSLSTRTAAKNEELAESNYTPLETMQTVEKIDILGDSPEQLSDKKVSDNGGKLAGGSSDNGIDSDGDSDSSNSGSDSGSHRRSRSRTPVRSQSGSSSDSESDATSSSKQDSDEDVDIMTSDDDKESQHKLQDSYPVLSKSPLRWNDLDNEYADIGNHGKQDDHVSDVVDNEKYTPEDALDAERPSANYSVLNEDPSGHHEQEGQDHDKKAYDGLDCAVNDGFMHGQSGTVERPLKGKSKRLTEGEHSDDRVQKREKLKSQNLSQPVFGTVSSLFGESPSNTCPDKPLDSEQLGKKCLAAHASTEAPSGERRPNKHENLDRGVKYSERSLHSNDGLQAQKGFNAEAQSKDGLVSEKRNLSAEDVGTESNDRKSEMLGKVNMVTSRSNSDLGYAPKDNKTITADRSLVINGAGSVIQKEHLELELGEFEEPFNDETPGSKKQFERKNSFRHLDSRQLDSEYWNSNDGRGKTLNNITADTGKLSQPSSEATASGILDGVSKRQVPTHNADDPIRPNQKSSQLLHQHNQSQGNHIEVGSQQNKGTETTNKNRVAEAGTDQGARLDSYEDTLKKMSATQQESGRVQGVGPYTAKENKKWKLNKARDSNDRQKDASLTVHSGIEQKSKESSLDVGSAPYKKYEKDEPELKGPVKDVSQYGDYVKEYQEKYQIYSSLSKILESYRDEFSKLGKDLEACKGRDLKRYNETLEQMRLSFRQCGERHKRLKKIFIILYKELKHLKEMIKEYAASYKKG